MTLRLRFFPDPILKNISAPLEAAPDPKFLAEMFALMKARGGVGLSAIQVGVAQRIITLDVGEGPEVYINPQLILPKAEKIEGVLEVLKEKKIEDVLGKRNLVTEGCLSFPGIFERILRFPTWNISYLNENFEQKTRNADGLRAHVLQHEGDHLDGRLFVDELRSAKRSAIMAQMMKLRKQGVLR